PEEVANDLEKLGATFIKLGQLLSTRGDLLPEPYLEALSRLQDQIEPFSLAQVEQIISTELGVRISKAFPEFDPEPAGSASLAQVHRARLRDGRAVVVKVQRPGVREQIVEDLEALEEVASLIDAHTPLLLLEIYGIILSEELFRAYLKQMLVDGFFHADPHPGNVLLTDDDRIALIDLGMVSNMGTTFQENLLRLLLAISEGRGDE